MLMMMWLIAKVLYDCLRAVRRSAADARFVLHAATAVTSEYNPGDSEILTLVLTMVACAYVASARAETW